MKKPIRTHYQFLTERALLVFGIIEKVYHCHYQESRMGRLIKFLWLITLFASLGTLLYTYASMGEELEFGTYQFSREVYFYTALLILVIFNFTFYTLSRNLGYENDKLRKALVNWQLSFAAVLNLFFITSVFFIMLVNSGESFNYNNFGYLIYLSLALIGVWILMLPALFSRKIIS
jgi:hypothetical protein